MVDEYKLQRKLLLLLKGFRFLYGRWILVTVMCGNFGLGSSDSSMVDEYTAACPPDGGRYLFRFLYGRWILPAAECPDWEPPVQIPLWSMNTHLLPQVWPHISRSDSSMVDEYLCSWFHEAGRTGFRFLYGRWIRFFQEGFGCPEVCSDSSMVDEYVLRNFKGIREFTRSDSSMVDEYALHSYFIWKGGEVQIPLWSMNTTLNNLFVINRIGSDSSMVDEYCVVCNRKRWIVSMFRFLYGRWILYGMHLWV